MPDPIFEILIFSVEGSFNQCSKWHYLLIKKKKKVAESLMQNAPHTSRQTKEIKKLHYFKEGRRKNSGNVLHAAPDGSAHDWSTPCEQCELLHSSLHTCKLQF